MLIWYHIVFETRLFIYLYSSVHLRFIFQQMFKCFSHVRIMFICWYSYDAHLIIGYSSNVHYLPSVCLFISCLSDCIMSLCFLMVFCSYVNPIFIFSSDVPLFIRWSYMRRFPEPQHFFDVFKFLHRYMIHLYGL